MAKRLFNQHPWHWRDYSAFGQQPGSLTLQLLAMPLFILAALLLLAGVFSLSLTSLAIGVIGLLAACGLHRQGRYLQQPGSERD